MDEQPNVPVAPRPRFRDFLLRLALVLCTGAIFVVFSELMFWGRYDFAHKVGSDLVPTIIVYSFMAYAFLIVVHVFRVSNLYALFMAGAVFGWLVEGVFVQTMYDDFPLNISFTGLAWHSILTVCCGWYLFRRALLLKKSILHDEGIGGCWSAVGALVGVVVGRQGAGVVSRRICRIRPDNRRNTDCLSANLSHDTVVDFQTFKE